jgi:aspartate/methionine/tyrosine aminotransferase
VATRAAILCLLAGQPDRQGDGRLDDWRQLFALADRYGFVIASDECYSEIFFDEAATARRLQAAAQLGRATTATW